GVLQRAAIESGAPPRHECRGARAGHARRPVSRVARARRGGRRTTIAIGLTLANRGAYPYITAAWSERWCEGMQGRILIPTTLSPESNSVFPYAITIAQAFPDKLYLLHVMDPDSVHE